MYIKVCIYTQTNNFSSKKNRRKVQQISKNITPFAGVFFAHKEFNRSGLCQLIDRQLGYRVSTKGYSYGNLFNNFFNLMLCGGECAEDIQQHFRVEINFKEYQAVSTAFTNFLAERNYRLVVMREKTGDPQLDLFELNKRWDEQPIYFYPSVCNMNILCYLCIRIFFTNI